MVSECYTDQALIASKKKVEQMQRNLRRVQVQIHDAEKEKKEAEEREQAISEQICSLNVDLCHVRGLFSGRKKRELEGKIEILKRELASMTQKMREYEQLISNAKAQASVARYELTKAKAAEAELPKVKARLPFAKVGNIVTYGHYNQNNIIGNDKEAIDWIVLDHDSANGKSLLLSRYGLDARRFDSKYWGWEKSEMRSWLNSTFLSNAFTVKEQKGIVTEQICTPKPIGYSGNSYTQDKLWLLSQSEAEKYFENDKARMTTPTKYAEAQGAYASDSYKLNGTGCCWWWLRSKPSYSIDVSEGFDIVRNMYELNDLKLQVSSVDIGGRFYNTYVSGTYGSVRPAFWLDLNLADIY